MEFATESGKKSKQARGKCLLTIHSLLINSENKMEG